MIKSKIGSRFRTTLPLQVRHAPGLHAGDEVTYAIDAESVILTRATPRENPFSVFCEWDSDADTQAYRDL